MNGVVFQTSTAMIAGSDVAGFAIQATLVSRICEPVDQDIVDDAVDVVYIHCHIDAETTVGIAQGTNIEVRTPPRPRKFEWMTSAMARPEQGFQSDRDHGEDDGVRERHREMPLQ